MQFAAACAGSKMQTIKLGTTLSLTAYAWRKGSRSYLAFLNKDASPAHIRNSSSYPSGRATITRLTAPSLDATDGIALARSTERIAGDLHVPAYSGLLMEIVG